MTIKQIKLSRLSKETQAAIKKEVAGFKRVQAFFDIDAPNTLRNEISKLLRDPAQRKSSTRATTWKAEFARDFIEDHGFRLDDVYKGKDIEQMEIDSTKPSLYRTIVLIADRELNTISSELEALLAKPYPNIAGSADVRVTVKDYDITLFISN